MYKATTAQSKANYGTACPTPAAELRLLQRRLQECGSYIYVYIMGTLPEYQNRGLGSTLLSHISTIADSKGLPCYLEVFSLPMLSVVTLILRQSSL